MSAPEHSVRFSHELLLYGGGDHGFVQATLPAVADALASDAEVLVAVSASRSRALREALGEQAERVRFADARALARNPARLIPMWQDFADGRPDPDGGLLAICESVWPGRNAAELAECERHEALVNLAFASEHGLRMLCPYDLDGLDESVIEAARASHPLVAADGRALANESCADAHAHADPFAGALPAPCGEVGELSFGDEGLAELRHSTSAWALAAGLGEEQADDLVLAVDELAANSIRHGGGAGTLWRWREHGSLVCEVRDGGTIDAPLIGRRRPAADQTSGRGVWLVNQLCDLVQIRSGGGQTVVRVHKRLAD
ncbi:MAG TPA: sensor histidine kinase [Solirubrobacteraceae bacterium]|jgi:anti-sigma regulatory factor (Ser/Thr protein kinase)|nr:sensor histidine kinase [Solirubrobacteraceae bacterium]